MESHAGIGLLAFDPVLATVQQPDRSCRFLPGPTAPKKNQRWTPHSAVFCSYRPICTSKSGLGMPRAKLVLRTIAGDVATMCKPT